MQDFNFDIEYRKGKYVGHVDYLSRNPPRDYRVNVICEGSWLQVAQRNDEETGSIIKQLNDNGTISSDFAVRQGILCRKLQRDTGRIVYRSFVPREVGSDCYVCITMKIVTSVPIRRMIV